MTTAAQFSGYGERGAKAPHYPKRRGTKHHDRPINQLSGAAAKNPIVVSASPLSEKLENFPRMRDAGAGAIVMYSLFEEQIEAESENIDSALEYGANSYAESTSYLPDMPKYHVGPDRYLDLLQKAKKSVDIPVIASLNGKSRGGWSRYSQYMEEAGADALELNIFNIPTDPAVSANNSKMDTLSWCAPFASRSGFRSR